MQIIPVIDLCRGQVVHARAGRREAYRPLRSALCTGSAPETVLAALLTLCPFRVVYIADLDAICCEGSNRELITSLLEHFPTLHFWVDAGLDAKGGGPPYATLARTTPVLGTENALTFAACESLLRAHPRSVLSLDIRDDKQMTPWLQHAEHWPREIIVMSLSRVGSEQGPDSARLDEVSNYAAGHRIYAAGGVRDAADLKRLAAQGISGVLLASALHDGRLEKEELVHWEGLSDERPPLSPVS